jgi:glucose-6-phosphate 1-dehydrogenase
MAETVTTSNPLWSGLRLERTPEPVIMVIFGATGDLTHRKLLPALYNLGLEHPLPAGFSVVGFARRPWSDEDFRREALESINTFSRTGKVNPTLWTSFSQGLFYCQGNFDDFEAYQHLAQMLDRLDKERGTCGNRIFYLATPPKYYPEIIKNLGKAGLNRGGEIAHENGSGKHRGWVRIIIEKPFGHDLTTARALNREVSRVFKEEQVYRIDHYLGKETVQNILVFRFANGIFEPIWNRRYVDHVQIVVAESIGIESRGSYYDEAGALRDMVQNHMLQLLMLTAMEPPVAFDADDVRDEKVKVLKAIPPMSGEEVARNTVRGQYGPGWVGGHEVPGYLQEPGVAPNSQTETYVALKLHIDNWRWAGVPFYLRTGKRLPKRATDITIQFKRVPHILYKETDALIEPNLLSLRIQPNEGISLKFGAKVPGTAMQIRPVNMDFFYNASFGGAPPEAYERLLLDCMLGDSTLFTRDDEVEAAWKIITSILEGWHTSGKPPLVTYEAGTWGPQEAETLIEQDGRTWRRP